MTDPGLHWIDWIIIAVYVSFVIGIGWYYGRRQKSSDEYFVGNRGMNPILVGISMYATLFSTITYLGAPGEYLSLIHICRCRRLLTCRSRWSPYH